MLKPGKNWPSEKSPYYFDPVLRWLTWFLIGAVFLLALALVFVAFGPFRLPLNDEFLKYVIFGVIVFTLLLHPYPYVRRWKRLADRIKSGLCPYCGYDRQGTEREDQCPECGGEHPHLKDEFRPETSDRE